ncbi:MAG: redoxin domain-containing protein [Parvibaculum sp.]|nr:redoxin domain-containing protein [Parvibaculum sp.]
MANRHPFHRRRRHAGWRHRRRFQSPRAYLNGAYGLDILLSLDFTFVCPSGNPRLFEPRAEIRALNVKVSRLGRQPVPRTLPGSTAPKDGGLGRWFPMVADMTKQIARDYDVLIEVAWRCAAHRSTATASSATSSSTTCRSAAMRAGAAHGGCAPVP